MQLNWRVTLCQTTKSLSYQSTKTRRNARTLSIYFGKHLSSPRMTIQLTWRLSSWRAPFSAYLQNVLMTFCRKQVHRFSMQDSFTMIIWFQRPKQPSQVMWFARKTNTKKVCRHSTERFCEQRSMVSQQQNLTDSRLNIFHGLKRLTCIATRWTAQTTWMNTYAIS